MNAPHVRRPGRQRGFTLIEALIALLVMAFGMLALSGMQLSLSRNADVAKQRTEAMRLAEARLEELRSFTGVSTGTINWNGLDATANTTVTTNTTYTVASTMSGVDADAMRAVNVLVTWTDRTGANQSVSLASVISRTDPRDPGFIGNPLPLNAPLKRPKNRNINIPIPALDLGGGRSATQFDANTVIVYSNIDAGVINVCDPNQANASIGLINSLIGTPGCLDVAGYILAGYAGRTSSSVVWPTGVNHSAADGISVDSGSGATIRCLYADATDQNTNVVIAGYKYYVCVIYRSPATPTFTWSGKVRLGGVPTTGNYIVCRYQYTQTSITPNERNVQPYVNVNMSMDEQNYLVTTSATATCPSSMTVTGVSVGVLHQDCRSSNTVGYLAANCPAASP